MPAYTGFNLATQGRNGQPPNVTQNYYTGLNRPNPIGNQLGNNTYNLANPTGTAVNPRPTLTNPNIPGATPDYSTWDTRYLDRENERIRQANIDGRRSWAGEDASGFIPEAEVTADTFKYSGDLDEDDPRVQEFIRQYGTRSFVDENGNPMQHQGNRSGPASGYRVLTLPESGQIYHGLDNQEYLQDGSRVMRLPDGRIIVENANYNGGAVAGAQRAQETRSRKFTQRAALTAALMIAGGVAGGYLGGVEGFAGAAGEAGAGAELLGGAGGVTQYPVSQGLLSGTAGGTAAPVAGTIAGTGGTNLGTYGSMTTGLDGGVVGGTASTGVGTAAGVGTGGATTAASALPFGLTARDLISAAGGIYNVWNSRNAQANTNAAANRADPYGPRREAAGQELDNFMRDPNYIYQRPGYLARQAQGEQGISRAAAGKGYFRSPNMLFDLSKFNSGLAAQEFDAEYRRLAAMAGVDVNPASAANILADGRAASTNMRTAGYTQLAGGFLDWLTRG